MFRRTGRSLHELVGVSDLRSCDPTWLGLEPRDDPIPLYNAYLVLVVGANKGHAPSWPFSTTPGGRTARRFDSKQVEVPF
jgi:hypothetical protein